MYSFRKLYQMTAEDREKYLNKQQTREEMLAEYLADCEAFAVDDDDSNVDSVDSSINIEIPF